MKHEDLKQAVIWHLKANSHELMERAVSAMELRNKQPSQLVNEVKRRFLEIGLKAEDKIIKSSLLTALPISLPSALVGHEDANVEQCANSATRTYILMNIHGPANAGANGREGDQGY